ncbi:hypothetical protein FRC20_003118 [Serendipita sp. 405]|nr:hypothetical protein FRC20_003118 [Serendipita sp. 405]
MASKNGPFLSDKRGFQYGAVGRQPSWDSVHALSESMQKMAVHSNQTPPVKPRRGSQSDSSSESAPVVTPLPSKDVDSNGTDVPKKPIHQGNIASYQPPPMAPGFQYRGPTTSGKPDEGLQVDYNIQPRHFIPGSMTSSPPIANNGPGPRANPTPGPYAPPTQGGLPPGIANGPPGLNGAPSMGNYYNQQLPGAGHAGAGPSAVDTKAAQDIAAQIALTSALQGLNGPLAVQPPNHVMNPALLAAAAAAAYGNPQVMPNLYANALYGASPAPNPPGFFPSQENVAAAVASAVAALPPAAFHAALQQSTNSDSEQQQTSMLARIKRNEATRNEQSTPSPPLVQTMPTKTNDGVVSPASGRPTLGALRVDTKSLEQTVPKNSYPYTSNPAMPARGLSLATDVRVGRLSPVPATAGADFGRHAAAREEVVGISPQSAQTTRSSHLRSVSQTFATSAVEANGGRASPAGREVHNRADSWGPNRLVPASAIEPPVHYNDRKW